MKKSFVLVIVMSLVSACALMKPATPPVYTQIFPKSGWIEGFASGSSKPGPRQVEAAKKIKNYLQQEGNLKTWIALKGSVDKNKFKNGCYTTQDGLNFFSGPDPSGDATISAELACENALGYSRALQIQAIITDWPYHNDGVGTYRVHAFKEVDFYRRPEGDEKNRAVGYWYIKLEENAKIQKLEEKNGTGELEVTYTLEYQTWWEQLKNKYVNSNLFKSRIRERWAQNPK